MPLTQEDLNTSIKDLKESVDRVNKKINRPWKIFFFGMLQGAGAVVGAVIIALFFGFLFNLLSDFPIIGGFAEDLGEAIQNIESN